MSRSAVIIFIVVVFAVYCTGQPGRLCLDPNAVWNNCGSRCEPTCPVSKEPRTCPPICEAKCTCKRGFILGPNGRCISDDECSKRTKCVGPSQVWNDCSRGCERTCIPPREPRACINVCQSKCTCAPGYIRGPSDNCITDKDCANLKKCDQNEVWNDCGNNCEPRCVETPRPVCPRMCVPKCMCKPGYVRGPNGKCMLKRQCPA